MDLERVDRCRDKLIEVSRRRDTIEYGELAKHIGITAQGIGRYLNAIYDDLVVEQHLLDLTLLAVSKGKRYGQYNSQGLPAQTVKFDPSDPKQWAAYENDREQVYQHWA